MLSTIVYSINPKQKLPVEGFTSFAETEELALRRKAELESAISGNGWKTWSGKARRDFIQRAKDNKWEIKTKLCLIDY
jgi:hypothetical protein